MRFNFEGPRADDDAVEMSAEFQDQVLPHLREIVQAAVAAGWDEDDVLLAIVELAWDLHEHRRGDL